VENMGLRGEESRETGGGEAEITGKIDLKLNIISIIYMLA
jgi:hypothetical protein